MSQNGAACCSLIPWLQIDRTARSSASIKTKARREVYSRTPKALASQERAELLEACQSKFWKARGVLKKSLPWLESRQSQNRRYFFFSPYRSALGAKSLLAVSHESRAYLPKGFDGSRG